MYLHEVFADTVQALIWQSGNRCIRLQVNGLFETIVGEIVINPLINHHSSNTMSKPPAIKLYFIKSRHKSPVVKYYVKLQSLKLYLAKSPHQSLRTRQILYQTPYKTIRAISLLTLWISEGCQNPPKLYFVKSPHKSLLAEYYVKTP